MTEITKDMLIERYLDADRGTAKYFLRWVCIASETSPRFQRRERDMACMVHGVDVDSLVAEINEYLASK